jgi:hypothetical protein
MAKLRSPNYPNYDLAGAIDLIEKVYTKDGRNKLSRATLAAHLGHESLSGPALGKIGALRAYGLIDGVGDELRVSDDAISALKAPPASSARKEALSRLALKPALFQMIRREYETRPSKENLVFWLIKQGFSESAAEIAARSYLSTMDYADNLGGDSGEKNASEERSAPYQAAHSTSEQKYRKFEPVEGERELITGLLSKSASFRLIVSGAVGVKEIERLIAKLELDIEILADAIEHDD